MEILTQLRKELKENSSEEARKSSQRFFKEKIIVYGIKNATVIKISNRYFAQIKHKSKDEIFQLCEELFKSGYIEEAFIACSWSHKIHKQYEEKDFKTFEHWVKNYVTNWATCDTLCNHTIGDFMVMFPKHIAELKKWAKSKNMWVRRASAVSLIVPAKKGEFIKNVFEIADILLHDKEDLVQKGYGWLLKEESRNHQKEVFHYVVKNKSTMPRTALRYAIELMPHELRKEAMKK